MTEHSPSPLIIIGGGASGAIMAAHLLALPRPDLRIVLIEKRPSFGKGIAYSTELPAHVLNVRASRMSLYADDPGHFWRWLRESRLAGPGNSEASFVPRMFYGRYLAETLHRLSEQERGTGRLQLLHDEAISVTPSASGVEIRLASGARIAGRAVILATGHEDQPSPERCFSVRPGSSSDTPVGPDDPILILGTGLSMADTLLLLEQSGHRGPVTVLSRRGLIPLPHGESNPVVFGEADIPFGAQPSRFMQWLRDTIRRRAVQGGDWRDVVDGLRPFNQRIWRSWPMAARSRFLRHAKARWDIHRHRLPPWVHGLIVEQIRSGRVRLLAGRVLDVRKHGENCEVRIQQSHSHAPETLTAARIYDCTGLARNLSASSNKAVRSVIDGGLARPDPLHLGLDVTPQCAVIAKDGSVSGKMFAIGPLTRGTFFEIDAVPDIRIQCAELARQLAG
ncbi:FAD/NAD(P)-binding protein [Brucella sp. IR073]|uniref:FAD/NAD(P)-binding protein n=1 Tax=unclassified Brucella TaxID=2632610 RepID=UPI003B986ED9